MVDVESTWGGAVGRNVAIGAVVLVLLASCGDDDSAGTSPEVETTAGATTTTTTTTTTTAAAAADETEYGAAPTEDPGPGQLRAWSVSFTGDLAGDYALSSETDLSVSTSPPSCSDYEVIVFDGPTRSSRLAEIDFSVADAITAPGTFDLTDLRIGVVGEDGFNVSTTYTGNGTLEMTRYDGGSREERRMTFSMSGSASDDSGGSIDVALSVDWNNSCAT